MSSKTVTTVSKVAVSSTMTAANGIYRFEQPTSLGKLPTELICLILEYIPHPYIYTLSMVCREWRSLLDSYFEVDLARRSRTLDFSDMHGFRTYGYLARVLENVKAKNIEAVLIGTGATMEDSTAGVLLDIQMTMTPGQRYHFHNADENIPLLDKFPDLEDRLGSLKELSIDRSVLDVIRCWSHEKPFRYFQTTSFCRLESLTVHLSIFGEFVHTLTRKLDYSMPNLRYLVAECGAYEQNGLRGRGGVLLYGAHVSYFAIFPALHSLKIGARTLGVAKPLKEKGKPYYHNRPAWLVEELENLKMIAPKLAELHLSGVTLYSNIFGTGPCVYSFNSAMKLVTIVGCSLKATHLSIKKEGREQIWSMKRERGNRVPYRRIVFAD
ncbi:uncharacterized protein V2V93DRAFT_369009 [Kockiozyma suomiensis]|uniref:uncharacterized protein n=1 Tax=Kockiozyma suomiensis TaxID=1337062 RepID=UPI003343DAD0